MHSLGELGLLTLLAIPLGLLNGDGLCAYLGFSFDADRCGYCSANILLSR